VKIKKISVTKVIWLLVFLNLFQILGYVNPYTRFTVAAIPNEEIAIAHALTRLRAFGIPTEGYIFTGTFSWRIRGWSVSVSPSHNPSEIIHYFEFRAITGWIVYRDINFGDNERLTGEMVTKK